MVSVKLRPIQEKVIAAIRGAIESGKTDIFCAAPTGVGKSHIGFQLAKEFSSYILTSEKSLQQQYEVDTSQFIDYEDVKSLCGIDSYTCHVNKEKVSLGICKTLNLSNKQAMALPCAAKCEYMCRRAAAIEANNTILNYSLYLIQMNYVFGRIGENAPFQPRDMVICDEAHKLPDLIESHFAVTTDKKIIERISNCLDGLTKANLLREMINSTPLVGAINSVFNVNPKAPALQHLEALEHLRDEYLSFLIQIQELKDKLAPRFLSQKGSVDEMKKRSDAAPRELKYLIRLCDGIKDRHCKIEDYCDNIRKHGLNNLVVDSSEKDNRTFHNLSDTHLFARHFEKFSKIRIYMSATLQPDLMIQRWGLDPNKCAVLFVPSDWDKEQSPVILTKSANMSYSNRDEGLRLAVRKINLLMDKHKDQRGVIHTTSNAITKGIFDQIHPRMKKRLVQYSNTEEKMEILDKWDSYPSDAVLIGASLTTGVDLKDDKARFNIIVQLSYPSMASALWAKRSECQPHIYMGETAAVLEQAAGRTTRSSEDWSKTYILDSRAENFILRNQKYFSPGFLDRIRLEKN